MTAINKTAKRDSGAEAPVHRWQDRSMRKASALIIAVLPGGLPLLGGYLVVVWIMGRFRANADTVRWVPLVRSDATWVGRLRRRTASRNDR
jgi:hypothetical protein